MFFFVYLFCTFKNIINQVEPTEHIHVYKVNFQKELRAQRALCITATLRSFFNMVDSDWWLCSLDATV